MEEVCVINNKIGQGKRAMRQLTMCITIRTIRVIYHSVVESITTYGGKVWELNKRQRDWLVALEMDVCIEVVASMGWLDMYEIRQ